MSRKACMASELTLSFLYGNVILFIHRKVDQIYE